MKRAQILAEIKQFNAYYAIIMDQVKQAQIQIASIDFDDAEQYQDEIAQIERMKLAF